ncbi:MAG: RNA methyltransferase, partial [Bacteroidetes bacterium]|nr:RNA methyltransferase [Bacteroidota bacterium]
MLSKGRIKELKSLQQKKYRLTNGLFIAEGDKLVREA